MSQVTSQVTSVNSQRNNGDSEGGLRRIVNGLEGRITISNNFESKRSDTYVSIDFI